MKDRRNAEKRVKACPLWTSTFQKKREINFGECIHVDMLWNDLFVKDGNNHRTTQINNTFLAIRFLKISLSIFWLAGFLTCRQSQTCPGKLGVIYIAIAYSDTEYHIIHTAIFWYSFFPGKQYFSCTVKIICCTFQSKVKKSSQIKLKSHQGRWGCAF